MDHYEFCIGRSPIGNVIEFIQLMVVEEMEVELGGCLHFEIADDEQRLRLAETFRAAADVLVGG